MNIKAIPEYVDGLPNICGSEHLVLETMCRTGAFYLPNSGVKFDNIQSAFATGLHMHQPLIPAGSKDFRTAGIISNLQYMMDHPDIGDNHNAPVYLQCYGRMGGLIQELVRKGKKPRVMLDYSGCLLHGLCQMGLYDVIDNLRSITCNPVYYPCVEWLGTAWGHAVAPSTPVQDYRLHIRAWQHFFAALFGFDALSRVRGFFPCEMALPNHPDVCYEFVKTLKDCGYRWVLVQEHTVERIDSGGSVNCPHVPHRLVAKNSLGQILYITAIIKTQGSDTKLVGQMQPYYEAKTLHREELAGISVPPMVPQIADGENGGVMMNEFPSKFIDVMSEATDSASPPVNPTEHLEYLETMGISEVDFPAIQPVMQSRIWDKFTDGSGPEALGRVIENLKEEDNQFHMEGGSWTNNISWVRGYERMLEPIQTASALFANKVLSSDVPMSHPCYRNALFHLLIAQTSCFRYWGEGIWTDYGRELCRRLTEILRHNF